MTKTERQKADRHRAAASAGSIESTVGGQKKIEGHRPPRIDDFRIP
jgi:hypothetical protein